MSNIRKKLEYLRNLNKNMDKVIEKKKGIAAAFTKKSVKWWALGAFVILVVVLLLTGRRSVLRVDGSTILTVRESSTTTSVSAGRCSQ